MPPEPAPGDRGAGRWRFLVENDTFLFKTRTDGGSTNTMRYEYELPSFRGEAAQRHRPNLPWFPSKVDETSLAWFVGHHIYTPEDISDTSLRPYERPYAGWLYGGVSARALRLDPSPACRDRLDQFEVQIGGVGRNSGGEWLQESWHHWTKSRDPNGWVHQLHNEPGINLVYGQAHRLLRLGGDDVQADAVVDFGASLGNVSTWVAVGATLRFGLGLPRDLGVPAGNRWANGGQAGGGAYLFVAGEGRGVWRNIFLDGNTFRSSHRVERKRAVGEFRAGCNLPLGGLDVTLAMLWRSHEYAGDDAHQTVVLMFTRRF